MVITSLTRNQVYRKVPWVRIPPPPPLGTNANPTRQDFSSSGRRSLFPFRWKIQMANNGVLCYNHYNAKAAHGKAEI